MAAQRTKAELRGEERIEAWIREQYPSILRHCLFHTASRSEAEDAVQDSFLKLLRYGEAASGHPNQRALLYRIARNTCIDLSRKRRAEALTEEPAVEEPGLRLAEADADLALLLSGLPPDASELLLLRYQQELSMREMAEMLGLPLRTLQSRLRAAQKLVKQKLEKEERRFDRPEA